MESIPPTSFTFILHPFPSPPTPPLPTPHPHPPTPTPSQGPVSCTLEEHVRGEEQVIEEVPGEKYGNEDARMPVVCAGRVQQPRGGGGGGGKRRRRNSGPT